MKKGRKRELRSLSSIYSEELKEVTNGSASIPAAVTFEISEWGRLGSSLQCCKSVPKEKCTVAKPSVERGLIMNPNAGIIWLKMGCKL